MPINYMAPLFLRAYLDIHKPMAPTTDSIGPFESEGEYMARFYQAGDCSLQEALARARKQVLLRDINYLGADDLCALRAILRRLATEC